jgi:hypothetical protein
MLIYWILFAIAVTSTGADRFALYLLPMQIVIFSRMPLLFREQVDQSIIAIGIMSAYGLFQFVWTTFGNYVHLYKYQFLLPTS